MKNSLKFRFSDYFIVCLRSVELFQKIVQSFFGDRSERNIDDTITLNPRMKCKISFLGHMIWTNSFNYSIVSPSPKESVWHKKGCTS